MAYNPVHPRVGLTRNVVLVVKQGGSGSGTAAPPPVKGQLYPRQDK